MPYIPLLLLIAVVAAGCAGDDGEPDQHPAQAMAQVVRHELAGRRADSFVLLVEEQRDAIDRELYLGCSPGAAIRTARVVVLGVTEETFDVPALGSTLTKAVRWQMTVRENGEPVTLARTGHLIEQDGQWRWTLSADSFALLENGLCP